MTSYDDPTTFRGQLQRGRGVAARRAASVPGAGDAVYECVIVDPRWDRQVETRDVYLAALVRELALPLVPLEQHLAAFDGDDPDDVGLLLDVLALLASAGAPDAVEVMRHYVRNGKHWNAAVNALAFVDAAEAPGVRDDLIDEAVACRTDDELQEVVDTGDDSWMRGLLERDLRIRGFYDDGDESRHPAKAAGAGCRQWLRTIAEAPRNELLQQVTQGSCSRRWALEELGRRGDGSVLDLIEDPSLHNPAGWIPGAPQALGHLGAAAVPRARLWLSRQDVTAELGLRVLAGSGDYTDVPVLVAALRNALDDESWCFAEIPAEGLGRLQVSEALPLLSAAWEQTAHSYARGPFLTALHRCVPEAAQTTAAADEGLSDCEPTVREIAQDLGEMWGVTACS
ncbi:hypothetical protein [Catenulispora subtropica]